MAVESAPRPPASLASARTEDDVRLGAAAQQLVGDGQVLLHRHRGTVPHVRLEQRKLAVLHALLGDRQQWTHEAVQLVLGAVVSVECDVDGVVLRDLLGESGEGGGARDLILDRGTGEVLGATRGDLDDT